MGLNSYGRYNSVTPAIVTIQLGRNTRKVDYLCPTKATNNIIAHRIPPYY